MTKIFEITDRSLKVQISKPMSFVEDEFGLEELTSKIIRKKTPNLYTLISGLLCLIGFLMTLYSHFYEKKGSSTDDILFYFIPGVVLLSLSAFNYTNVANLFLVDRRFISFYAKSPNKKYVESFFEQIFTEQKKYLLERYAKPDQYLSSEQLSNNLQWLWDRKIINNEELESLRVKILPKPNSGSSVGFKITPPSTN